MLARAILSSPDVLLLDEPTNHLDFQAVEFLEDYLARSKGAYLVVTHDRRFLDRVAEEIVDLENGRLTDYSGGYTSYRLQKAERILTAQRAFEKQQEFIEKEKEYIRRNIAGRQLPSGQGATDQARARRAAREADRRRHVRGVPFRRRPDRRPELPARQGPRRRLRGRQPIVRGVGFELLRGERMAILGENGTGKTTLLKTLAGRLAPLAGAVSTGHDVSIGYYDQELQDLDPRRRAIDAVWDQHPGETEEAMRGYLARFAFRGDDVFSDIASLSGGEKGRLTLAVVMRQQHNLLLLDEPTNHLDLDSREALEESLEDFPGSIVFVSHDRAFIDRLATRVVDLRDGRARLYPGNYSETAEARAERRKRPEPPAQAGSGAAPQPVEARCRRARGPAPAGAGAASRRAESAEEKEATRRRRRIRALEEKIEALENEIETIETRLWEEALTLGPVASRELAQRKTGLREELDGLVEEWAKLSEESEKPARQS